MVRLANSENDIEAISKIAQRNSKELGFVMKVALRENMKRNNLLVVDLDGTIVGFCNFHIRKDGTTTIYEICVDKNFRGNGYGKEMIKYVPKPIMLKCPIDNESNNFYRANNFELIRVEEGRKRALNV